MFKRLKLKHGILPAIALAVFTLQGFDGRIQANPGQRHDADTVKQHGNWPSTFGLGRTPTPQEIAKLDIDVRPDGLGLPAGSGTPKEGLAIYQVKCLACHTRSTGNTPVASLGPALITDSLSSSRVKTIGNYWPYASTVYDYINRAMPYNAPGSLTANEVYALTAYLLHANKIIPADAVMNAKTLPQVKMPAEKMFVPDDRVGGAEIR